MSNKVALWGLILVSTLQASDSFLVTCVNSSNKCDNNSLYKTCNGDLYGKTFFSFRPQDSDSARRILGWFNADYRVDLLKQEIKSVLTISPQYTRSLNPQEITQWFFFNGRKSMTVGLPDETHVYDIDGSQIGLSLGTSYDPYTDSVFLTPGKIGSVWAKPVVENYIIDLDLWYDLSSWHENLWSRLECPIVYMQTNMHMYASGRGNQTENYPNGLFSTTSTLVDAYGDEMCNNTVVPYSSILCALAGNQGWGAVEPLSSGKFPLCGLNKWGVAGLHFDLGYDIWDIAPWFFAGSLHVVFPTGNRPKGTYVFEPIVGANKSWQFGATVIAHYIKEFERNEIGIYLYAVGTHLFKSKQDRVFSLRANGPGSQLLLLKQFGSSDTDLIGIQREANVFCGKTKIGATLMFDGSLMLQFSQDKFVADVGYNFWVRTKERRSNEVCFREYAEGTYGIKGSEPMSEASFVGGPFAPVLCSADFNTDSAATIALSGATDATPTFISPSDIDYGSALAPTSMSHKVFAAVGFKSSWFALLSGEAEFGTNNTVINQWGVMLKLGKEF